MKSKQSESKISSRGQSAHSIFSIPPREPPTPPPTFAAPSHAAPFVDNDGFDWSGLNRLFVSQEDSKERLWKLFQRRQEED